MALAALACKLFSVLSVLLVYSLPFALAFDHIEHAYITCGSTVHAYIRRISIRLAPQLNFLRQLSALIVFVALRLTFSVCCFHCSLASIVNPSYLHVTSGRISPHSVWIGVSVLMRLRDLVKWVSWNLFGAKTDACVLAHCCAF